MRVVIIGYFGFDNCGDEAMLAGTLAWLRRACPDARCTALSLRPPLTAAMHGIAARPHLPMGPALPWKLLARPGRWRSLAALKQADLVLWLGGSGLFSDARGCTLEQVWPLFRLVRRLARRLAILSASVGPIRFDRTRELIARMTSMVDALATRDTLSHHTLTEIVGPAPNIVPMADLALEIPPPDRSEVDAYWRDHNLDPETPYLAFCPLYFYQTPEQVPRIEAYRDQYYEAVAGALGELHRRRGLQPLFIPFQGDWDERISRAIAEKTTPSGRLLPAGIHPRLMIGILKRMRLVIPVRLHAQILSLAAGVPLVPILYDDKCLGFAEDAGLRERAVEYPYWVAERPPLDGARLVALAGRALDDADDFTRRLTARAESLRERNRHGAARLRELGVLPLDSA
jgi:polysaccharide pyruvyl transferase WcaK-like protein